MEKDKLEKLRHSTAHLMAAAVVSLWPSAKPTIGPAIESGFYYDFDFGDIKISEADFVKIEEKMKDLIKNWSSFEKQEVSQNEAKKLFKDNPYKLELIGELVKQNENITIYKSGEFFDLCRGGHIDSPKDIKYFKLTSIAGAYWRGDEKNKMLTRIYGTAFPTQSLLSTYLEQLDEAKKYDHRKIGKEMELFFISEDVGPGLILWLPKGNIIKEEIETWAKETEKAWGYKRVTTPEITKSKLYYTSGHLPYYKDDMYPPMKLSEGEEYYLKPMNCPHHHMIFASKSRSYRELPLRLAEYGRCYRYEASGELFGLMRVRGFAQNDAHIYCTENEAVEEFISVMELHKYFYETLGIKDYYLELSLRDPKNSTKYHGDNAMWEKAESLMRAAVHKIDIKMTEKIGGAAFYGPKIDFIIKSSVGREFAISTNQIDLFMGKEFKLTYTDQDGVEKTPVIIHRAPLGSHERFVGFLIEHYKGIFPTWLAPVQAVVLPITDKSVKYAKSIFDQLIDNNIRAEFDDRSETLGSKIRDAQLNKFPYMIIIGEKEEKSGCLSLRTQKGEELKDKKLPDVIARIKDEISNKTI